MAYFIVGIGVFGIVFFWAALKRRKKSILRTTASSRYTDKGSGDYDPEDED